MNSVTYNFTGNRYVVTGASSGMGRQVVLDLAAAGAEVLAIARNEERLAEVKGHFPDQIETAPLDVTDNRKMEEAIASFVKVHGKFNGAVHAAGIFKFTPLRLFDENTANDIMDTNFWAGIRLVQLVSKVKFGLKGASFVLFSSVDANGISKGQFAYSASKAALNAATKQFAKELAPKGNRINTVMPGVVYTAMTIPYLKNKNVAAVSEYFKKTSEARELLGNGNPEDVSSAVLFLLSDGARWITGTNMVVDGGYLA